ncbi:HD domain-containing phosphohydrolase [Thermodesulfobacteriota bacterium]
MDKQLKVDYESEIGAPFTDNLTSLFNNGFFQVSLQREIKRIERQGGRLTLALIDIDSFSSYNKRHGPLSGDKILASIAKVILENVRQIDLAARYSGDVMAVVLIDSDTDGALIPVGRIKESIKKIWYGEPTVSIGLAEYPKDAAGFGGLIRRAEEALSKAKMKGKDRVHFFEKQIVSEAGSKSRILVVDDEPRNIKLLDALLRAKNYEVIGAENGEEALSLVKNADLDLILLDVMMPGMDGYEVCRRIKGREETRLIPVVMLTALDESEAKVKGIEAGADDFLNKPPNKIELLARVKSLLNVKSLNKSLTSIESVLFSLANTVEAKDVYTQGHIQRVSKLATDLARKMKLSERKVEALRIGGILHDIGKIAVSKDILNKPGPLNAGEWEIMKGHSDAGYRICLPLKRSIGEALDVIRHHHEKLNGSGYPDGLKGDQIPIEAKIMSVVDIYDALITERPYRKALPKPKAFEILKQEADDKQLDKEVVRCLIEMVG